MIIKNRGYKNELAVRDQKYKEDIFLLKDKLFQHATYGYFNLTQETVLTNDKREDIVFGKITENGSKLVFRFTESNCWACVEAELLKLEALNKIIPKERIVLLTSYADVKSLSILKKKYKLSFPIYNISLKNLAHNSIETLNIPYLFVVDHNSGPAKMVFIPDKSLPGLSGEYYKMVSKYLLN